MDEFLNYTLLWKDSFCIGLEMFAVKKGKKTETERGQLAVYYTNSLYFIITLLFVGLTTLGTFNEF